MSKTIKALINTGNEQTNKTFDVVQGNGAKGKPTTIKAVKGARYHLEDPAAKNVGPENIRSKRVGKNLHVMLDGSNEADLIIEDYFDKEMLTENNRGLYGRAEDGKLYEYIPEDPTPEGMPINLADGGRPVSQVLGGGQIGEAFELSGLVLAAAGGGFSALTAGAAVVGGAALAGGGGGGGGSTDTAAVALASIKAAAENNTATSGNLSADVFKAAGVTGVDSTNLAAIQSALDSAAVNGNAADTKEEVQAIVDAYNAIKANADGIANNNATNPTQAQYAAIGVTGVDTATEESLLGDAIDGKPFSAVDTVAEVQILANAASAVMTGAAGGTAPTKAQLEALGITGVTDANLSAIQAAIAATPDNGTGVDTLSELQAVANTGAANAANAAAALSAIAAAAQANDATDANVAASVFSTAGVTGVDSSNVAAIQSALNSAAVIGTSADTLPEVQAIVDAYNAIKANADGTANNNATNPTQAQYAAIGVTGVDSNVKASLLGDVVDSKPFSAVDTVPELQALADAAAAVMTAAAGTTRGNGPTRAQLEALGITGVTDANLQYVQDSIARTADDGIGVDTLAELQAVVTIGIDAAAAAAAAAAAITAISAAAQVNNATDANVAISVFVTAGVTGVDSTNVAAIQSALNSANVNGLATDTLVEIQNIVNAYNAIRENADGTANNYASNPTQAEYALIGVTGVNSAAKESLLGDAIDGKPFSAVDSVPEVQALADAAAAVMTGAAGGAAPTQAQLAALGITGVTPANLAAVLAAIAATPDDGTGVDTLSELQAVATNAAAAAAALDTIAAAAQANDASNANVPASVFVTAGITGVTADNVAAIQSALNSTAVIGTSADTKAEVQAIVDAYNAIKANADGTPNNNATNPTQAQYAAIGVTGVDTATEESLLGDAIDGKPFSAVDTVAEVQALADAAAAVIASTTTGTRPSLEQLTALGITGVTPANLAAVQAAIAGNASGAAGVDTLSELQAVTDAATANAASIAALELIKNAAEGNTAGTTPSLADFVTAGITGVDSNNFAAINSALNSSAVNGLATDTKSEVQAIVDAYKAIKDNADTPATTNATAAQYTAVGVTGIDNPAKASLLGDVVDGKTFAEVDTVPELQALATAAAAVISGATAGGTVPNKAQLEALGITGVTDANLSAIQAAIAATPDDGTGVDTLSELQTVVTNAAAAAAATAAALSTIAAAAQANNASDTNVPASVFVTAGITGVTADNLAAIQSALNDTDVQSSQADTAAKVQAVVDAYNAIKANADTASTTNATQAQYAAIGINGIDNGAKTNLLGDVVDTKDFVDVNTVDKLQALATAAAAVISGATAGGTVPTQAQLAALGITGVTTGNLAAVLAAIAATPDDGSGVDSISELQNIVNAIVATTNDAPTGTNATIVVAEDGSKTFAAADFGFADASDSPANALSAVIITTLPTAGTLKLGVTAVTLGQSIAVADLGNLVFAPAANANGTGYATIGFKVQDNGGTANGGVDTSTTANTLTFNVTAVNDAATFSGDISKATSETNVAQTITGQLNVADIDSATTVVAQTNVAGSAALGHFSITTAGDWTYVMDNAQNQLKPTDVITDSLTVSTADGTTKTISVVITGTNDLPTGAVTISGNTAVGSVLTATTSTVADVEGLGSLSYSWYADGAVINGATSSTYTLASGDAGKTITAKVSYTDGGGTAESVVSNPTAAVTAVTPGQSVVDLGADGKLIVPVQVGGDWFYYWDRSGDGTTANSGSANGGLDYTSHNTLDAIFKYDINGVANTTVANADGVYGTTDVYRYGTINGVFLALPISGSTVSGYSPSTAVSLNTTTVNPTYGNSLLGVMDAYNGTVVGGNPAATTQSFWNTGSWWAATPSAAGHYMVGSTMLNADSADTSTVYTVLQMVKANAAPVLDAAQSPVLTAVSASAAVPTGAVGDLVSTLVGGVTDADSGALKGMAITGVHAGATLYYSLDGGTTWQTPSTTLSDTNALLLAADSNTRVFYKANGTSGTISDAITFRAWDQTQNVAEGLYVSTVSNGGKAEFSTTTDTVSVYASLPLSTSLNLGTFSGGGGTWNLINKVTATNGKVYYFVDVNNDGSSTGSDGVDHNKLDTMFNGGADTTGTSSPAAGDDTERSVILAGYTLVLPTVTEFKALSTTSWSTVYGWTSILSYWTSTPNGAENHFDATSSANVGRLDTYITGLVVEVKVPVAPVVLDLNRDGTFSYSQVAMDVDGSNQLSLTQWAGAQDGVLVWDKLGDGKVHDNSQYAFGQYATSTRLDAAGHNRVASDLDGLSDAFDTNHDGKFNAADDKFAQFSVWRDANQNGVSDAGEVRSLTDWGITEINLVSDGVQRTPVAGVTEVGQSTAAMADGSSMQVADALFAYNALDYSVEGVKLNLLGENMKLDLSSLVAAHHNVASVDLSGTGANTLKLNLSDVLGLPTTDGMHTLTLTGDANDTVNLDMSQWANSGNTVTQGEHTYAVYNASSAAAAQLLIDQHMVLANHG